MSLLLSLLFLVAAPLLYRAFRRHAVLIAGLDGFLFIAICGLVVVDVLPGLVVTAGWWVILFALVGFFGPTVINRGELSLRRSIGTQSRDPARGDWIVFTRDR